MYIKLYIYINYINKSVEIKCIKCTKWCFLCNKYEFIKKPRLYVTKQPTHTYTNPRGGGGGASTRAGKNHAGPRSG